MILRYITNTCCLLALLAVAVVVSSCDDDENKDGSVIRLDSFGPSNVLHGEDISFIGQGLDKVTSIVMPPNVEVAKSEFKTHTANRIVLTVPMETMEGKITLKTPQGDIITKTFFGLEYEIDVTSMTAEARPGEDITITGEFLNYVTEVKFTNQKVVTEFKSQSRTSIVVTVPMDAQTGPVAVLNATGSQEVKAPEDLIVTLPNVTAIAPGMIKHTHDLTLTGTNLDLVTSVTFEGGSVVNTFESKSVTELVVKVPNTALDGKLVLHVSSGLEVTTPSAISIILPIATGLSPDHNPGDVLTITGTDLDMVKEVIFPGGAVISDFTSQSATSIVVTIPASATAGSLKFKTIYDYTLLVAVPFGDQSILVFTIYDDEFLHDWQNWSWGGPASETTEEALSGSKSLKKTFDGSWDALQLGNGASSRDGSDKFSLSIFGGPGTDGKLVRIIINESWGVYKTAEVKEGQWTTIDATWAEVNNPANPVYRIAVQAEGWSGTIYVDKIGFK